MSAADEARARLDEAKVAEIVAADAWVQADAALKEGLADAPSVDEHAALNRAVDYARAKREGLEKALDRADAADRAAEAERVHERFAAEMVGSTRSYAEKVAAVDAAVRDLLAVGKEHVSKYGGYRASLTQLGAMTSTDKVVGDAHVSGWDPKEILYGLFHDFLLDIARPGSPEMEFIRSIRTPGVSELEALRTAASQLPRAAAKK